MKAWGVMVLGLTIGAAAACGSSDSPPNESGNGGTAGSRGGHAGSGDAAGDGGSKSGRGGSAGRGGSGGTKSSGGTGGAATSTGGTNRGGGGGRAGTHTSGGTSGTGDESGGTSPGGNDDGGTTPGGTSGDGGSPPNPPVTAVAFAVHTSEDVHPISPLIYGMNPLGADCSDASARFTLCRLGGNRWSTYNWENNASNYGDPCFENDGALSGGDTAGGAVTSVVADADGVGAATLVTLPILDYVAADKLGGSGTPDCTGDVRDSGNDFLDTRFKQNVAVKGAPFVYPPDKSDAFVYSDELVAYLRDNTGSAKILLALDNQPGLWGVTHAEIHPASPTYAEVVARDVTFATVARDQWPAAEVTGYTGYGYADFLDLQGAPDATGNGLFVDYYLDGLAQASIDDGRRLIDYLDVHWFPEIYADGARVIDAAATPDLVHARVQAPRSLWDSSFVEDSWITNDVTGHQAVRLIPWLKEHIAAHFPGTKLAISEWSYGGGTDVSGAVAAADVLGIFGREDVGLAAWASQTGDDPFVLGAFQIFRNYDGAGAAFGDTSVAATSDHEEVASVYASTDSGNANRVVIVAINRSETSVTATLSVDDTQTFTTADVYALTSASPTPAAADPLVAVDNAFVYAMPAYSVSVLVPKP